MSALGALRGCSRLVRAVTSSGRAVAPRVQPTKAHGTWNYRTAPPSPPRKAIIIAELSGGLMWWWVLWHVFTEPEHMTGEWPQVTPSEWTNEELGIPPDSAGPATRLEGYAN